MKTFSFCTPTTLSQAQDLLSKYKGKSAIVAGGTDVMIALRDNKLQAEYIININKLKDLRYIKEEGGRVHIGALSTFADIERNLFIQGNVKSLHYCCANVGSPQIRNMGTIGGNVANASPAGDSISTLMSLDATVVLQSDGGKREMKLSEFYANCPKSQLKENELLTEIYFDTPGKNTATAAYKLGKRKALAIVVVGFSVLIEQNDAGKIKRSQVVLGASSKVPVRLADVEEYLMGKAVAAETFAPVGKMISDKIRNMIAEKDAVLFEKYHKVESIKCISDRTFAKVLADLCGKTK